MGPTEVKRRVMRLSNAASSYVDAALSGAPAREVRLFHFGWNTSTKGRVWFDQEAADLVMAEFRRQGVLGMIDLEHMSLDDESPNWDPDARGWFKLEVRADAQGRPELWMLTKWNADGARRIVERFQRYVSPAFAYSPKTGRVLEIINVALVAMPATHRAQPLIAASARVDISVRVDARVTWAAARDRSDARRQVAAFATLGRKAA